MHIPVGLSSEELEQLRADALRAGPTNPRPSSHSPVATADGHHLGDVAAEARRHQLEFGLLRRGRPP